MPENINIIQPVTFFKPDQTVFALVKPDYDSLVNSDMDLSECFLEEFAIKCVDIRIASDMPPIISYTMHGGLKTSSRYVFESEEKAIDGVKKILDSMYERIFHKEDSEEVFS